LDRQLRDIRKANLIGPRRKSLNDMGITGRANRERQKSTRLSRSCSAKGITGLGHPVQGNGLVRVFWRGVVEQQSLRHPPGPFPPDPGRGCARATGGIPPAAGPISEVRKGGAIASAQSFSPPQSCTKQPARDCRVADFEYAGAMPQWTLIRTCNSRISENGYVF